MGGPSQRKGQFGRDSGTAGSVGKPLEVPVEPARSSSPGAQISPPPHRSQRQEEGGHGGWSHHPTIAYHLLTNGTEYTDLGPHYFDERAEQHVNTSRIVHRLEALGYSVQLRSN